MNAMPYCSKKKIDQKNGNFSCSCCFERRLDFFESEEIFFFSETETEVDVLLPTGKNTMIRDQILYFRQETIVNNQFDC